MIVLNLNEIVPAERHTRIFAEFDRLKAGETLEVLVDHDPKVLQREFKTLREGTYSWQVLESTEDAWKFRISKIEEPGCCGCC